MMMVVKRSFAFCVDYVEDGFCGFIRESGMPCAFKRGLLLCV
jgi:hypothetical protein